MGKSTCLWEGRKTRCLVDERGIVSLVCVAVSDVDLLFVYFGNILLNFSLDKSFEN